MSAYVEVGQRLMHYIVELSPNFFYPYSVRVQTY